MLRAIDSRLFQRMLATSAACSCSHSSRGFLTLVLKHRPKNGRESRGEEKRQLRLVKETGEEEKAAMSSHSEFGYVRLRVCLVMVCSRRLLGGAGASECGCDPRLAGIPPSLCLYHQREVRLMSHFRRRGLSPREVRWPWTNFSALWDSALKWETLRISTPQVAMMIRWVHIWNVLDPARGQQLVRLSSLLWSCSWWFTRWVLGSVIWIQVPASHLLVVEYWEKFPIFRSLNFFIKKLWWY